MIQQLTYLREKKALYEDRIATIKSDPEHTRKNHKLFALMHYKGVVVGLNMSIRQLTKTTEFYDTRK